MSLATVLTRGQAGMDAPPIAVEVHLSSGLPGLAIVGLVETAVRESRERVRAAITQSGFDFPQRKITVNLAPADLPKNGGRFDLAIALGILAASGQITTEKLAEYEFFGELAFTGELRPINGLLPAIVGAMSEHRMCVVPRRVADEVSIIADAHCLQADHLIDVVRHLGGEAPLTRIRAHRIIDSAGSSEDLADVEGQMQACRALQIAAAGGHNMLMIGPPGTGKTMLARRLPGLLPSLSEGEVIENVVIQSVANTVSSSISAQPPFRAPHHTASAAALVGGGNPPGPGEISLAHNGVLFLDELPEFSRPALQAMREPMETGWVSIARAKQTVVFPSRFQLVAAMNPCPCGFSGEQNPQCRCTPDQVRKYQGKISGPLLDRIDIGVHLRREPVNLGQPEAPRHRSSAELRELIGRATQRQRIRTRCANAHLSARKIKDHCWPDRSGRRILEKAADRFALSRRCCDAVLRVARTISDLSEDTTLGASQVAEALQYRVQISTKTNC